MILNFLVLSPSIVNIVRINNISISVVKINPQTKYVKSVV